jgi:hypothetical protein
MQNRRKYRILMGILGAAVIATAVIAIPPALASPAQGYNEVYYSDASHTQVVGTESLTCLGRHTFTGQRTVFEDFEEFDCL